MKSLIGQIAAATVMGLSFVNCVQAEAFPERAIRLVVPFAPGGGSDAVTRLVAERMSIELGQSVVVENKPGASGIIGVNTVAKARPDGYTLVMANSALTSNPWLYELPFDVQQDLSPVTMIAQAPQLLVAHPSVPFDSVAGLIDFAKTNPGQVTVGTAGAGQVSHLAAEVLQQAAGIEMLMVHYKGTGASVNDLLGGQIMLSFGTAPGLLPHVKKNTVIALGTSGPTRLSTLPDTPMIGETIPNFSLMNWFGIFAPAGTPEPVIAKLHSAALAALADPKITTRLNEEGFSPDGRGPQEFSEKVKEEMAFWKDLIETQNIRLE